MDPRQLLSALTQIVQQLAAAGVPQEAVMAALQGAGQPPMPQPGMGAGPGPDLPPGIPQGRPPMPRGPMPMNGGGGMPPGIFGPQ